MAALVASIFGRPVPFIEALGIALVERLPRGVVLRLPYRVELVGNPDDGVLYGGAVSSLVDTACGFAAMVALPARGAVATLDLRIDFLRPAVAGADLLARAECYRLTRRIAFCRATTFSEASKDPVAEALGTFMIADPATPDGQA
ncbi:MAG: PaaI family thioesterase [Kiloniellales bacterium]